MRYPWHIISDLSAFNYIHVRDRLVGGMAGDGTMGKWRLHGVKTAVGGRDVRDALLCRMYIYPCKNPTIDP